MRIGLISDIHANLPALEAVIDAMGEVDKLLCAGDMVGYYAEPNEVCAKVRSLNAVCVRGNHDAYVTGALVPNAARRESYRTDWTRSAITEENRHWLEGLPTEVRLSIGNASIIMRHASPWDEETYLYPDSERLNQIQLQADEIMIFGHTHWPMLRHAGAGLIVNPGSVGQPRDYNPDASFAVIDSVARTVSHRRAPYGFADYQLHLADLGWDEGPRAILSRRS